MVLTVRTLAFLQPPSGGVCLQPLVSQLQPPWDSLQGFGEVEEPWGWVSGKGNPKERWEHLTSGLRDPSVTGDSLGAGDLVWWGCLTLEGDLPGQSPCW